MHLRIIRQDEGFNVILVNENKRQAINSFINKDSARKYADMVADCLNCAIFEGPEGYTLIARRVPK